MGITLKCEGVEAAMAQVRDALDALGGQRSGAALARAFNRSLQAGRSEAAAIARKAYTARKKKLFDSIFLRRATYSRLEATLELSGSPGVSLIHFKAQPDTQLPPAKRPAGGVTAQIKRGGSRRAYNGKDGTGESFVLRKKQGGHGVFVRSRRKSLEMLFGPSPVQALQRKDDQERVMARMESVFQTRFKHEIDVLLSGIVRK